MQEDGGQNNNNDRSGAEFGHCVEEHMRTLGENRNDTGAILEQKEEIMQKCREQFGRKEPSAARQHPVEQPKELHRDQAPLPRDPFKGIGPAQGTNGIFHPLEQNSQRPIKMTPENQPRVEADSDQHFERPADMQKMELSPRELQPPILPGPAPMPSDQLQTR
jgi:hypothetical protein